MSNSKEFVNQVISGDNVEAGETFKKVMQDKQLDAIDLKRVDMQLDWLNQSQQSTED